MGEVADALVRSRDEERERDRRNPPAPPAETPPPGTGVRAEPPEEESAAPAAPPHYAPDYAPVAPREGPAIPRRYATAAPQPAPSAESVTERLVIPADRGPGWAARLCAVEPSGPAVVRLRHFAVRLRAIMDQHERQSVLVTSALAREGKSTISMNLALAMASVAAEYRIALVDFDLRNSHMAKTLGYEGDHGIEDVLEGRISLADAVVKTDLPSLDIFPTRRHLSDAHTLLGGAAERVLAELHRRYDYLICDGPPVLPVPDVPLLIPHVGGFLAVVAAGRSRHAAFGDLLHHVPRSACFGVFVNESRSASKGESYRYGYGTFADEDLVEAEDVLETLDQPKEGE